jgi:hypothetical protein
MISRAEESTLFKVLLIGASVIIYAVIILGSGQSQRLDSVHVLCIAVSSTVWIFLHLFFFFFLQPTCIYPTRMGLDVALTLLLSLSI